MQEAEVCPHPQARAFPIPLSLTESGSLSSGHLLAFTCQINPMTAATQVFQRPALRPHISESARKLDKMWMPGPHCPPHPAQWFGLSKLGWGSRIYIFNKVPNSFCCQWSAAYGPFLESIGRRIKSKCFGIIVIVTGHVPLHCSPPLSPQYHTSHHWGNHSITQTWASTPLLKPPLLLPVTFKIHHIP